MSNHGFFLLHFAAGESVSQGFSSSAEALDQGVRQMNTALTMLYESELRGTFLAAFENHSVDLMNALRALVEEITQIGRDVQTVVERARLLDTQTALRWMQGSGIFLPDTGGGSERIAHIDSSIARLEGLQVDLRAQLADVQARKNNPVNMVLGLRDDYEAIEVQLTDTMARNSARIDQLRLEQLNLEQAATTGESGFGQLIQDQPTVAAENDSGFGQILEKQQSEAMAAAPAAYAGFVHRQYDTGDTYGCSLYAQSSVLEAIGYDFEDTLNAARAEGKAEGWYDRNTGSDGDELGNIFESYKIPYDRMGGTKDWSGSDLPDADAALTRLQSELQQGHFPVVSFWAPDVAKYAGQHVNGHTIWVTGLEFDGQGEITSVIANDSHFGQQVTLPIDQFMQGWGNQYNYQAVFARRP